MLNLWIASILFVYSLFDLNKQKNIVTYLQQKTILEYIKFYFKAPPPKVETTQNPVGNNKGQTERCYYDHLQKNGLWSYDANKCYYKHHSNWKVDFFLYF